MTPSSEYRAFRIPGLTPIRVLVIQMAWGGFLMALLRYLVERV